MQFESWIGFGDSNCARIMSEVENAKKPPDSSSYSADEKALSQRLYAILSSYLRGRYMQLVRANHPNRDGFALWYEMIREFIPSTKQRALALAQTLSQFPSFKEKSMLESVLQYENLVQQYESASGQTYPSDLKAATLIRCSPPRLREHLQLSLSDVSTYADVREALLAYERISKSFFQEQILKQLEAPEGRSGDGPTPMEEEVDKKRVMRVVRSLLEAACATSLQGCYPTAGCENVWSLYGIIGSLLLVVVVLCAVIKRYMGIVEKFKIASREVRRLLHQRHGAEGEEEEREIDPLVAEATVGWFGERDGEPSELVPPADVAPTGVLRETSRGIWGQRRLELVSAESGANGDAAGGFRFRGRDATPSGRSAHENPVDENVFGAPDISQVPEHLQEHAIRFLEGIPEGYEEFKEFKETMLSRDRGPECFTTNQAAFVVRRIEALRESNQHELKDEFGAVHRDLLHRLDQCREPEGLAEQYVWMLHEGSIIENMYARHEEMGAAGSSEVHDCENEFDEREKCRGSLSECSDPDGWLEMNFADLSIDDGDDNATGALQPGEHADAAGGENSAVSELEAFRSNPPKAGLDLIDSCHSAVMHDVHEMKKLLPTASRTVAQQSLTRLWGENRVFRPATVQCQKLKHSAVGSTQDECKYLCFRTLFCFQNGCQNSIQTWLCFQPKTKGRKMSNMISAINRWHLIMSKAHALQDHSHVLIIIPKAVGKIASWHFLQSLSEW